MTIAPSDDLVNALKRMSNADQVATRMLESGITIVENRVRSGARRHVRTGQLADSVTHTKPKLYNNGVYRCSATFKGKDKNTGVTNAQKAFVTEYGKSNQPERPFIRTAVIETEAAVLEKMQEVFEFETDLSKVKI